MLAGAGVASPGFASILQRLDFAELQATLAGADPLFLAMVPIAIIAEQPVRAWKWRQILHSLHPVRAPLDRVLKSGIECPADERSVLLGRCDIVGARVDDC